MKYQVVIRKDDFYEWDEDSDLMVPVSSDRVFVVLRKSCNIDAGVTLGDIFRIVDKHDNLKEFLAGYSWCHAIQAFHDQAFEPPVEDKSRLTHLEICKFFDTKTATERKKHPGGLRERIITIDYEEPWNDFIGIGPGEDWDKTPVDKMRYSVSYSPMNEIAHLEVKLVHTSEIYPPYSVKQLERNEPLLKKEVWFTLLEVLDAIYWDISWHGTPEGNAEFLADLDCKVSEIESGQLAAIPLEQVEKRLGIEPTETPEGGMKVVMHPDVARAFGVDPDSIPLDDKEILRNDDT